MALLGKAAGHDVEVASGGADALALVKKSFCKMTPFDAIFLDMIMPGMDGPTTARGIMALGFKGLMIGCTGFDYADPTAFMKVGVNEIFEKPLSVSSVAKIVTGD